MPSMVSYPRRLQSGHITCYLNRTYHVLTTKATTGIDFRAEPGYLSCPRERSGFVLGVLVGGSSAYPITDLLLRWREGDAGARETLVPLVYDELRRIARKCLTGQRSDHTLQPTALVHEAYLRLVRPDGVSCQNRAHFFSVAARVMRQILVDHSRRRVAAKRGGGAITLLISDESSSTGALNLDFLALEEAMRRLAILDARQCQIVELRFFGGLSIEETAQIVEISPATAKREWATARIWLYQAMSTSAEI